MSSTEVSMACPARCWVAPRSAADRCRSPTIHTEPAVKTTDTTSKMHARPRREMLTLRAITSSFSNLSSARIGTSGPALMPYSGPARGTHLAHNPRTLHRGSPPAGEHPALTEHRLVVDGLPIDSF